MNLANDDALFGGTFFTLQLAFGNWLRFEALMSDHLQLPLGNCVGYTCHSKPWKSQVGNGVVNRHSAWELVAEDWDAQDAPQVSEKIPANGCPVGNWDQWVVNYL